MVANNDRRTRVVEGMGGQTNTPERAYVYLNLQSPTCLHIPQTIMSCRIARHQHAITECCHWRRHKHHVHHNLSVRERVTEATSVDVANVHALWHRIVFDDEQRAGEQYAHY